jgi:voltage-gated potassium channel
VTRAQALEIVVSPRFTVGVTILILLSTALTVGEATLDSNAPERTWVEAAHVVISIAFSIELWLRFKAASRGRKFFREHWYDLLALLPVLPLFRELQPLRLLRLLRLMTAYDFLRRQRGLLPYGRKRGPRELLLLFGLVLAALTMGSAGMLVFERHTPGGVQTFGQAFWFNLYSLIAAEPIPGPPATFGGKVVSVGVIFMGLITFATIIGTVSASVSEGLRSEGTIVDWEDLHDHIIICGWNRKAELIVSECRAAGTLGAMPIVVIAEVDGQPPFSDPSLRPFVQFLNDDFTKVDALEKAGVRRATRCIILSDMSKGRRERDADARTILAALTIEKLNHDVYTCAEINRREYGSHLEIGNVNDYVVSGEHSAFLLAQAALNPGVMSVFTELLTYGIGNRFYRCKISSKWQNKSFFELFVHLKEKHDAILIAVETEEGKVLVNPTRYVFVGTERLVVIASKELEV